MNVPAIAFLSHVADVELKTGNNAAGEPLYATKVSGVACMFEQIAKQLQNENGDIVAISAQFMFGPDYAFVPRSRITFSSTVYDVINVNAVRNADSTVHHYELLCR